MINEKSYIEQTEKLIEFYKDKNNQPVKEYILTCHRYISELRGIDIFKVHDELQYEKLFKQVLSLVEETFRPYHFNSSFPELSDNLVHYLDDEFIIYFLMVQKQLKRPIKWNNLLQLQLNFGIMEIQYKIKNGFNENFTQFAIKNISLSELWTTSI